MLFHVCFTYIWLKNSINKKWKRLLFNLLRNIYKFFFQSSYFLLISMQEYLVNRQINIKMSDLQNNMCIYKSFSAYDLNDCRFFRFSTPKNARISIFFYISFALSRRMLQRENFWHEFDFSSNWNIHCHNQMALFYNSNASIFKFNDINFNDVNFNNVNFNDVKFTTFKLYKTYF